MKRGKYKIILVFMLIFIIALIPMKMLAVNIEDVSPDDWFYYCVSHGIRFGLIRNVRNGIIYFEPNQSITRAEFIVMLGRLHEYGNEIIGVADDLCNEHYFDWAIEMGIIHGDENGDLMPEALLMREQAAAIVYRYINAFDLLSYFRYVAISGTLFRDFESISAWAVPEVMGTYYFGVMCSSPESKPGMFAFYPQSYVARADALNILVRICRVIYDHRFLPSPYHILEFPELVVQPEESLSEVPLPVDVTLSPPPLPPALVSSAPVNDPLFNSQWNLKFINAIAAWSKEPALNLNDIVVAVIDSGIYKNHSDFNAANILPGRNFAVSSRRPKSDIMDESGHGTGAIGVIAATRNNELGIASIAYGATILPLRIFCDKNNMSEYDYMSKAVLYAVENGAHIINMSFSTSDASQSLKAAVNHAASRNVWMIAAVGNHGTTEMRYPAGFKNVIGVGAVGRDGTVLQISQRNSSVFVVAPGAEIFTTTIGNQYVYKSGTSFAAPHITALAAIARAHDPDMTIETFRNLLRDSVKDRGQSGRNDKYGYGIVDAELFMKNLKR